jgi:proline dehydrogenase
LGLDSFSYVDQVDEDHRLLQKMVVQLAGKYGVKCLSAQEHKLSESLVIRLSRVCEAARDKKVRLHIDAEQTYMQPAIDHLATKMQRAYNTQFPTVFNSYQCYLDIARNRIDNDLERSQREGWIFAAKLCRGAYMNRERELSVKNSYKSPILPNIEETHATFNYCMIRCLENIDRSEVFIATHNQESIEMAVDYMRAHNIDPKSHGVYFAQLLGMADHLSLMLGQSGYKTFKYVPYGPVAEVLPYLIRRAQENGDVMAGALKESKMLWQELKRRKFVLRP